MIALKPCGSRSIENKPATPRQKSAIARLCFFLKYPAPLEEQSMSRLEARDMIYYLLKETQAR